MSLVCAQCSRANPADASYCYHDGAALAGRAGGPVNAGSALFPSPFVFPDGLSCRNFDQLAVACQQHWHDAVDLLKKGFLGSFLGNMGRIDLARASQEAAEFPDADRGLDQLLAKLPTQALQPPQLKVEPTEINLGQLQIGAERATELHLSNLGMRLLYGSVAADCKWLALGEVHNIDQKLFQFGADTILPVHVVGKHLRAGNKPLEGRLVIESNGGSATVTIRAEVPVTPFQDGLFAGAVTPRKVAEKAKANPKEAAPYFEGGAVAAWYASNGWPYPVQGPTMKGMGGIQQFFEALGVAKPPKVELATAALQLAGERGQVLQTQIEVTTAERKPAYAWAACDQDWIEFGTTKLNGRSATVPVTVRIPARAATVLEAKVQVMGNGNQKFVVPLKVSVAGALPHVESASDTVTMPAPHGASDHAIRADLAPPLDPFAELEAPTELLEPRAAPSTVTIDEVPLTPLEAPAEGGDTELLDIRQTAPSAATRAAGAGMPIAWPHLVPLAVLVLALVGALLHDYLAPAQRVGIGTGLEGLEDQPLLGLQFDYHAPGTTREPDVVHDNMNFGLAKLDPHLGKVKDPPRLTYGRRGHTNSTLIMVDSKEYVFGDKLAGGKWDMPPRDIVHGKTCTFLLGKERIAITQEVRIVPGEPYEVKKGDFRQLLDTCLVKYRIENRDNKMHNVGIRFLLDTYIADNDGVPFTLPGVDELVSTQKDFKARDEVPDFIQVLQRPDLKQPGLIMQLSLRISDKLQSPDRVSLTHHPGEAPKDKDHWTIPMSPIDTDSAVVMYWNPEKLKPKAHRDLGFTYGLGNVSISETALVGLTVGGSFFKGGELTVVALVADPEARDIKLDLPEGLSLQGGAKAVQPVPPPEKGKEGAMQPSPVTWRVRAGSTGDFNLVVTTNPGGRNSVSQSRKIKIAAKSLF